ncbi:MAG: small ribosomal subunit Rsm22 family protein [Oligoflexia bacterium]|nr:small ribosomal subunit Rsm22 family protein [Oligoflexia bacterium]
MRVPAALANAFDASFESLIGRFAAEKELVPSAESLRSHRFLARSVLPHVTKLSMLFNRRDPEKPHGHGRAAADLESGPSGLAPYWKESSNPENLRLAYFLSFMPPNLFRVAAVWSELGRLGFRWRPRGPLSAIEFGAGPATAACGIAAGERHAAVGLPAEATWALLEQDRAMLELGVDWAGAYFADQGFADWGTRPFHRKLSIEQGLLPRSAPRFQLWLMSFFLNELSQDPAVIARALLDSWERHLDDEGIAILIEPALKAESRKLLELRRELIAEAARRKLEWFKLLLPCLGHQACGALAATDDWCHEEVTWWRPPYLREIDKLAGLDRKTLPFSYLVVARSTRSREELLPALAGTTPGERQRLVSPAHFEGKEQEFFVCGEEGKRRARYRAHGEEDPAAELERGDVLLKPELRGDVNATRISRIEKRV